MEKDSKARKGFEGAGMGAVVGAGEVMLSVGIGATSSVAGGEAAVPVVDTGVSVSRSGGCNE